jgi:hypothetical protein
MDVNPVNISVGQSGDVEVFQLVISLEQMMVDVHVTVRLCF